MTMSTLSNEKTEQNSVKIRIEMLRGRLQELEPSAHSKISESDETPVLKFNHFQKYPFNSWPKGK